MDEALRNGANGATKATPVCGSEAGTVLTNGSAETDTPGSENNPEEWFFVAAQGLLGKDAGFALALLTEYPQSSCYAYVAKAPRARRRPPGHFLRKVIHSDQGGPFHEAFMDGCKAAWWLQVIEDRRQANILREAMRKVADG